jgi:hypothetical protein
LDVRFARSSFLHFAIVLWSFVLWYFFLWSFFLHLVVRWSSLAHLHILWFVLRHVHIHLVRVPHVATCLDLGLDLDWGLGLDAARTVAVRAVVVASAPCTNSHSGHARTCTRTRTSTCIRTCTCMALRRCRRDSTHIARRADGPSRCAQRIVNLTHDPGRQLLRRVQALDNGCKAFFHGRHAVGQT